MSIYLSQVSIAEAVERLSVATAQSSLADFLIFKRALVIAVEKSQEEGTTPPKAVITGTRSEPFVLAIEELTLRIPLGTEDPKEIPNPYYLPFGSARDSTLGYRTRKYPSNGSSDTVSRWQSRAARPLSLAQGSSPKAFLFEPRTQGELREFFVVKTVGENCSGERPLLIDAAAWWFRFTDLEERFGGDPTAPALCSGFVSDLDLSEVEMAALFVHLADIAEASPDSSDGLASKEGPDQ